MNLLLLTGMSGSGKSTAFNFLEDMGYNCVDNLPVPLIENFAKLIKTENNKKVAVGIDIRCGKNLPLLKRELDRLEQEGNECDILFLDAEDSVILKRFKETRRSHPLAKNGRIYDGIEEERKAMDFLKKRAKFVIDTSHLLTRELNDELKKIFTGDESEYKSINILLLSFGFKYGIPQDADLIFDVRFLPNPYYDLDLRPLTGNDKPIRDFVLKYDESKEFLDKLEDLLQFLIPNYIKEGKNSLVIGIGCTGGKHRSVTLTNEIYKRLSQNKDNYGLKVLHRDIERDRKILK